jgi:hypothetical protein
MEGAVKIIDAPAFLYTARQADNWRIDARSVSGGVSLDGGEQIAASIAAIWRADISLRVFDEMQSPARATRRQVNAFLAQLRGRQTGLRLRHSIASYRARMGLPRGPEPHSDGRLFGDGTGYAVPRPTGRLTVTAPALSSSASFDVGVYPMPLVGDCIRIGKQMVEITEREVVSGTVWRVGFEPMLRETVSPGSPVDLDGWCVMRLTADDSGSYDRTIGSLASTSLSLVEIPGLS